MESSIKVLGYFVSVMNLTLSSFMMTVSVSQKMRDFTRESGVLRSIGLTKRENTKIFYYEISCIVIGSCITGIASGLISARLVAALNATISELT